MDAAGLSVEWLAQELLDDIRKLHELQGAKKVQFFMHQGEVIASPEVADNTVQLKATERLMDFVQDAAAMRIRQQVAPAETPDVEFHLHIPWLEDSLARNAGNEVSIEAESTDLTPRSPQISGEV